MEITDEDLTVIEELAKQPDMITKLVDMLAPTIIGHDEKKLGIIMMYVGATETEDFRGRIHGLFIGPPGTAKSKLAQAAKRLGQPHRSYWKNVPSGLLHSFFHFLALIAHNNGCRH